MIFFKMIKSLHDSLEAGRLYIYKRPGWECLFSAYLGLGPTSYGTYPVARMEKHVYFNYFCYLYASIYSSLNIFIYFAFLLLITFVCWKTKLISQYTGRLPDF